MYVCVCMYRERQIFYRLWFSIFDLRLRMKKNLFSAKCIVLHIKAYKAIRSVFFYKYLSGEFDLDWQILVY